jgi:hypothetical protein
MGGTRLGTRYFAEEKSICIIFNEASQSYSRRPSNTTGMHGCRKATSSLQKSFFWVFFLASFIFPPIVSHSLDTCRRSMSSAGFVALAHRKEKSRAAPLTAELSR